MSRSSESEGIKPTQILALAVCVAGVFGFGLIGTFQKMLVDNATSVKVKQNGVRGSLTSLTKKEVAQKLNAVPLFYVERNSGDGKIFLQDGVGRFFLGSQTQTHTDTDTHTQTQTQTQTQT